MFSNLGLGFSIGLAVEGLGISWLALGWTHDNGLKIENTAGRGSGSIQMEGSNLLHVC